MQQYGNEIIADHFSNEHFLNHSRTQSYESINENYEEKVLNIIKRLQEEENLLLPLRETLEFLDQLTEFELGRYLIQNQSFDAYWTAYITLHAQKLLLNNPLEKWLIEKCPGIQSNIDRFHVFQSVIQQHLHSDACILSVPCGLMDDLFRLDYSQFKNIKLIGVDLDPRALHGAKINAQKLNFKGELELKQQDAWSLNLNSLCDLVTSNGLCIYEKDDEQVVNLYEKISQYLKPKGTFITSFLTPPEENGKPLWVNYDEKSLVKQQAVFKDILQAQWQTFRSEDLSVELLERAGFKVKDIIYDPQRMYPVISAIRC